MKVLVTGVAGQLGHDVMNELAKRGHEGIGSDLAAEYSGIADGSAVTKMPYVSMDITDAAAVETVLQEIKPDAVVHCAAWTAVDLAAARRISQRYVRSWTARWSTFPPTTYLTDRVLSPGIRTAKPTSL